MNHTFTPIIDENGIEKCSICNRKQNTHGQCECCPNTDTLVKFKTMMMCLDCYEKEKKLTEESTLGAAGRVADLNAAIRESQVIDVSINTRSDFFNAATIAIADLKAAIDADTNIENKNLKLAEVLMERFAHFKSVAFELQEKIVEANNHQKAIQVHLNTLANSLRAEEREKLKIQDLNYKPNPIKPAKDSVTRINKPKKNFTQAEVVAAAKKCGANIFTIQAMCVAKNTTPDIVANMIISATKG